VFIIKQFLKSPIGNFLINILILVIINTVYYTSLSKLNIIHERQVFRVYWPELSWEILIFAGILCFLYINKLKWTYYLFTIGISLGKYQTFQVLYSQAITTRIINSGLVFFGYIFISFFVGLALDIMIFPKKKDN